MTRPVFIILLLLLYGMTANAQNHAYIEVSGSSTINIVPDRISIEIGLEEYFKHKSPADSVLIRLPEIEQSVRGVLAAAGVGDSLITVSDIGNSLDSRISDKFHMAKRLSAVVTSLAQLDKIADSIGREGITSFQITGLDNSDMPSYNRQGLKSALDAAKEKAEFIASNSGLKIVMPMEIVENGPAYYGSPSFSNVSYDSGAGIDNMRKIVRRYSVKVKYRVTTGK